MQEQPIPGGIADRLRPARSLTIIAIGASAGGLDPLKDFFRASSVDDSLAHVVITHLPATHESHLAELLAKAGPLPVTQAIDGEQVLPGRVYVVPPSTLMGLRDGHFCLGVAIHRPPAPKPIDHFMTSLAEDAADRSIGIVLSGTDHDGTAGLKAIKAAGGMTIVQAPETAQFPGMPISAITANVADQVLAPVDMPAALRSFLQHGSEELEDPAADKLVADRLNDVLGIVLSRTGHDFRWYRPSMLRRRQQRRMRLHGMDRIADYITLLEHSRDEVDALKSEFLIGVTDFFRDQEAWELLASEVLPALLTNRHPDDPPIRVWTPGCATGEESYSIAMLLLEQVGGNTDAQTVQVFGTDIDAEALGVARRASYPESIAATVSPERLARFFERRGDRYIARKQLRDAVLFAPHNLARDTPFSKLDIVLCRNLLIYFETELQERVLELFHFALKPGGYLLLGKAESVGVHTTLFAPASRAARLFKRIGGRSHLRLGFGGGGGSWADAIRPSNRASERTPTLSEVARLQLAQRTVSAAFLVDREGRVLHFHGQTGQFLQPQGDATLELPLLVRHELRAGLRSVLRKVVGEAKPAGHHVPLADGLGMQQVRIEAEPVAALQTRGVVLVMFIAAPRSPDANGGEQRSGETHAIGLEAAIEESRRGLSLALEDAERSNEDLRVAHEESLALNEELQSSNEELESSKEELQSLNEELATVNAQLEDKMGELARSHDDLSNLLSSTHIATILLDREFRIRRFTPAAAELFSLQAGDEGRLLSDIASRVDDPRFEADLKRVLESSDPAEAEVQTEGGTALLRRISPYRTGSSGVEGVVATFVDVTPLRDAAQQMRHLVSALDDSNDAVIAYDPEGKILSWNGGAERAYGFSREEVRRLGLFGLIPPAQHESAREVIRQVLNSGRLGPLDAERTSRLGKTIRVSMTVTALRDDRGEVYALLSTERDLTERLRFESEIHFRRLADDIPALLRVEDESGRAEFVNRACSDFTGQDRNELLGEGWLQFMHPEDRSKYLADYGAALPTRARFEIDIRMLRHDGVYRWMRSISVPHFDPNGAYSGYVALTLDVQDRKHAETELMDADRRKDEYLAMLAHELRNPLAPIRNSVALLSMLPQLDPKASWATGVIERQTDVLAKLLDDLLDVARIARGKITVSMVPVEVAVLVERAQEISRPLIEARRHRLTVDMPDTPLIVEGDLLRLTQVLANLLNNAAKYTDEGGHIRVDVERVERDVVIRVSDDGAGMSADMVPRVFDLFAQADRTLDRSKGGLGLGLTLVRQLVALHRGSVEARSSGLGKGSEFLVRLPLVEGRPIEGDARLPSPPADVALTRRVLLVDDNEDAAQSLAMILTHHGHQVCVENDGSKAVATADRVRPQAVILDIGLPGVDGYHIARSLRGRAHTAKVLLIALTGYGQPEDVERALAAGFDYHFIKPVQPSVLHSLLLDKVPPSQDEAR